MMCDCISFLITPCRVLWEYIYSRWVLQQISSSSLSSLWSPFHVYWAEHVETSRNDDDNASSHTQTLHQPTFLVIKEQSKDVKRKKRVAKKPQGSSNGNHVVSLFSKQGHKGVNQDVMLFIQDFASVAGTVFCGVFDGHGPHGHLVAKNVGLILPEMLASYWNKRDSQQDLLASPVRAWKDSLVQAYKTMDRELLIHENVDCVFSGTTAVTLVRQDNNLILGNVGDSRAVLATLGDDDSSFVAIQLTVDLKPDLPSEAERIKRLKGRVFAARNEPATKRVWLPRHNTPGLAMSRALGDYCLKNYGVISEPEVTHWHLTKRDKFVVLATDGVWDVLSNQQVVEVVASAPVRSMAGKVVVDTAVRAWKSNHATSRIDDCAVVCLYLDDLVTTQ